MLGLGRERVERDDNDDDDEKLTKDTTINKPVNIGDYSGIESFRVIFIPNNNEIQPYEVTVLTSKSINEQLEEILKTKATVKDHLSKKDSSYILFPSVDLSNGREGLIVNERASNLFRKKPLIGDALFISFNIIYRDISLEEFLKVEKFISKKLTVFDFESSLKLYNEHDLIWIFEKKTAPQFLNEYNVLLGGDPFKPKVTALKPAGPFVASATYDGINFYSKLTPQKVMATNGLGMRVLRYFIARQNIILFNDPPYIDTTESEYNIEIEVFNKDQEDYKERKLKEDIENGIVNTSTTTTTTTKDNDIKFNECEPIPRKDVEFKEEEIENGPIEMTELYGIKIKKDHEIIGIKGKEIYKHVIKRGSKPLFPTIGNSIQITYTILLPSGNEVHEKSKLTIVIGETDCLLGIHYALTFMNPGEHSIIVMDPNYAYGELGIPGLIPAHSKIIVHLELSNNFDTKSKRTPGALITMSVQEKISAIRTGSDLAKNNFNSKKMGRALRDYRNLVDYYHLDYMSKTTQEEWDELQKLASVNYVNIAICYSKLERWDRTLTYLKDALEFEDHCSKTHYWIAKCYKKGQNYEDAIKEIEIARRIDSESDQPRMTLDAYRIELDNLKKLLSHQELDQRKMYKRIFDNLSLGDKEKDHEKDDDLLFNQNNDSNDILINENDLK